MKKVLLGLLGIMVTATFTSTVAAAADDWKFAITPYLWGAGVEATINVKGHEADVKKSVGDIVSDLDLAAMVNMQARKGRFGAYTDVTFVGLSDSADLQNAAAEGLGRFMQNPSNQPDQHVIGA